MSIPRELEQQLKTAYGVTEKPPLVNFVDWALKDEVLTKETGRPRYRDLIFIEMRPRDGSRDIFREIVTDEHKLQYPKEWAEYEKRKGALDVHSPKIGLIPGMTRAKFEELTDLGIVTCADLVEYPKSLDELDGLRAMAKKIMEACNEKDRSIREERTQVGAPLVGQLYSAASRRWPSGSSGAFTGTVPGTTQAPQDQEKESFQEETFRYSFG